MYSYSPIKRLIIKNFRNIGSAEIDFTESPIVSLIGENESGKTSVVKAFAVCAAHDSPRDQKDYIRDGTDGFGVGIELMDGTQVQRIKLNNANRYSVKYPDGREWDASKIDSGLPVAVQEVMGLIEEPETKEFLHIRTYEDQLLFVVTSASTNYKVMYDALKVDQLTRAIAVGSKEANQLKADINAAEYGVETLTDSLKGIKVYDMAPLSQLKSRLQKELAILDKVQKAANLHDAIVSKKTQLGAMEELTSGKVTEVNEVLANKLNNINNLLNRVSDIDKVLSTYKGIESAETIDTTYYTKLVGLCSMKDRADVLRVEIGAAVDLDKVEPVDLRVYENLMKAANTADTVSKLKKIASVSIPYGADLVEDKVVNASVKAANIIERVKRCEMVRDAVAKIDEYCAQVEAYLKYLGADVEICPKCGEAVVIDVSKYKG